MSLFCHQTNEIFNSFAFISNNNKYRESRGIKGKTKIDNRSRLLWSQFILRVAFLIVLDIRFCWHSKHYDVSWFLPQFCSFSCRMKTLWISQTKSICNVLLKASKAFECKENIFKTLISSLWSSKRSINLLLIPSHSFLIPRRFCLGFLYC